MNAGTSPVDAGPAGHHGPLPRAIGRSAIAALYEEVALSPKPGLVTPDDPGSHDDMDARTFMRSLFALRSSYVRFAELGWHRVAFEALERCGIAAEQRMLRATGGINTHRGAIFTLGLLCAAAGAASADGRAIGADALRGALLSRWGADLQRRAERTSTLPGGRAARRHGLRGASQEAALGFPVLFDVALPAWARGRRAGLEGKLLRLHTLFHVMAVLDDCNLAHRGGIEGLRHAQDAAAAYLAGGGVLCDDGLARAHAIGAAFVRRRLSPGGSADMLAACCWFDRVAGR